MFLGISRNLWPFWNLDFQSDFSEHFSERSTLAEFIGHWWFAVAAFSRRLEVKYPSQSVPKSRTKLTRLLWYTLGTAHDFESKRLQSAKSFSISVFAAHQAQLAIIFLWSAIPLIQIAWQGDFEQWVSNPRGHPHLALDDG
jgi:Photosystem I psaA/psaB protein